ncbi:flagellar basal body rod protein FlgC [Microbulbifer sp. TYP-18]|uniref:flagellar basal body rod protein FlgC n=1 Tax=Microbulbifer sp. TYP-18 TaxID=3230024 RepID=UPI0034C64DD6
MSVSVFDISLSGLELQRLKSDVVALNISNSSTVARSAAEVYRPIEVLATAGNYSDGIGSISTVERNVEPHRIHDPSHPFADDKGFVYKPAVDSVREMINLMTATRSYQANIQVLEASKKLIQWAIESGAK